MNGSLKIVRLVAFVATLYTNPLFGQPHFGHLQYERKGIVEREALIFYLVRGQNILISEPPPIPDSVDEQGRIIKRFSVGTVEDSFGYAILPNDIKLSNGLTIPLGSHFEDLVRKPYFNFYNDIFLISGVMTPPAEFYQEIGLPASEAEGTPNVDIRALTAANDVFLWYMKSYVAKSWRIKGEWEVFEVDKKPVFFAGLSPTTLQFDKYRVHVLKKISSLEPVTELPGQTDMLQAVKGSVPTTKVDHQRVQ